MKSVNWLFPHTQIQLDTIKSIENTWKIEFPDDYKECALNNHGGTPRPNSFDFDEHSEVVFNRLLSYDQSKKNNILKVYERVSDRLPKDIYPFADDPFGNLLCFDYRKDNDSLPCIVYWNHEEAFDNPESAIYEICDTFTELISKLYTVEE